MNNRLKLHLETLRLQIYSDVLTFSVASHHSSVTAVRDSSEV